MGVYAKDAKNENNVMQVCPRKEKTMSALSSTHTRQTHLEPGENLCRLARILTQRTLGLPEVLADADRNEAVEDGSFARAPRKDWVGGWVGVAA